MFPVHLAEYDTERLFYDRCFNLEILESWEEDEFTFDHLFPKDWEESCFSKFLSGEEDWIEEYNQLRKRCKKLDKEDWISEIENWQVCCTTWHFFRGPGALDTIHFLQNY